MTYSHQCGPDHHMFFTSARAEREAGYTA